MIALLSNQQDFSTTHVMQWLGFYNYADFRKLNFKDFNALTVENQHASFDEMPTAKVNAVWFRRHQRHLKEQVERLEADKMLKDIIYENMYYEQNSVNDLFIKTLEHAYWLNHPETERIPKVHQTSTAQKVGMFVPDTILTTSKTHLLNFAKKHDRLIIKSIETMFSYLAEEGLLATFTSDVDEDFISQLPEHFFPCHVQEKIEKEYEIRTFYLAGECFSMAIFSQTGEQTSTDYRNLDYDKPNRRVPYSLPKKEEKKVHQLMKKLQLNTGSLDIIKSTDGRYVFLEVNPIGQFGMVSIPCNFNLEQKIALHLMSKDKPKI